MIVISLSSTVTISLFVYILFRLLFRYLKFSFFIKYSIFVLCGSLSVFIFMIIPFILQSHLSYSHLSGFIKYKLHSLTNRFDAQILAYELLDNTLLHLFLVMEVVGIWNLLKLHFIVFYTIFILTWTFLFYYTDDIFVLSLLYLFNFR